MIDDKDRLGSYYEFKWFLLRHELGFWAPWFMSYIRYNILYPWPYVEKSFAQFMLFAVFA